MKLKWIVFSLVAILSQFETSWGDEARALLTQKPLGHSTLSGSLSLDSLSDQEFRHKIIEGLKKDFDSEKFIKALGPGVTGGGDSCEQKIAYSFSFLLKLVEQNKVDLTSYGVSQTALMAKIKATDLKFGKNLQMDRPVEMINVPSQNLVILDRKICTNNFEPLYYYTPLLLHEVLRLVGVEDGRDYKISSSLIPVIQNEIRKGLNLGRSFRILSGSSKDDLALAWGVRGTQVDFESYDLKSREEQWAFFDGNAKNIENYLVDLKTMKVLAVVREAHESNAEAPQGPIIEFTEKINTNHNDIEIDYDPSENIAMIKSYAKWWGGIDSLLVIRPTAFGQNQIVGRCENCEESVILPALYAKMTKKQIKALEETGFLSMHYDLTDDGHYHSAWKVTAYSQTKMKSVAFEGIMRLTFEDGVFKANFGKVKQTE